MRFFLAQVNFTIADFRGNAEKILENIAIARQAGADMVVFSELAITGYPPEDLLDYPWFVQKAEQTLREIATEAKDIAVLISNIEHNKGRGRRLFNSVFLCEDGEVKQVFRKTLLPTYDIFTEERYFETNEDFVLLEFSGKKIAVTICEDLWDVQDDFTYKVSPMQCLAGVQPDLIISPSASPWNMGKPAEREEVLRGNALKYNLPILYVNQVGCHNELIFDGGSLVMDAGGKVNARLPRFQEGAFLAELLEDGSWSCDAPAADEPDEDELPLLYEALVYGIRDYCAKTGFRKAVLGSSGGIDSAVVQCLASDALGAENVTALLMPSEFSSEGSVAHARQLSENLANPYHVVPIADIYQSFNHALAPAFAGRGFDVTEENIQARSRGVLLMACSNKFGNLLLNTSNKSEMAVGYGTLYGDMAGGISVIGDVYKTKVYALARYINRNGERIPDEILTKAPSAELRPGQKDSDSLPEYDVLDRLLEMYVEERRGRDEIIAEGFGETLVDRVLKLVNRNEYKRWQAPPVLRVTRKSFGSGRRMPLVAKY